MADSATTLGAELRTEVRRVSERLRHLASAGRAAPELFAAARALTQQLADLTAEAAGEPQRPVPLMPDSVVGDQVAVVGADLLAALAENPDPGVLQRALDLTRRVRRQE